MRGTLSSQPFFASQPCGIATSTNEPARAVNSLSELSLPLLSLPLATPLLLLLLLLLPPLVDGATGKAPQPLRPQLELGSMAL